MPEPGVKLQLTLNSDEIIALLVCVQSTSDQTWTNLPTRHMLNTFKDKVVEHTDKIPMFKDYLKDKGLEMGDFS